MASNKPPVLVTLRNPEATNNNETSNLQFSVGNSDALVEVAKGGKVVASVLRDVNQVIQSVLNVVKPFLALLSSGVNMLQGIINIGKTIVEDALAIGGYAIIVHPWNQRNKAYKSMIYNKPKRTTAKKQTEKTGLSFTRINNWFEDATSTVSTSLGITNTTNKADITNLGIPQLTVAGAIDEVIWACDNIKDPLRPQFTSRMYTCGIGFILNVTNPLDLTQLIDALKALFDFSEFDLIESKLKKRIEQFEKQMKNRGTDFLSALLEKNTAEYQKEWAALGIETQMKSLSAAAAQSEIDQAVKSQKESGGAYKSININPEVKVTKFDLGTLSEAIGKALIIGDSGPKWFGFNLGMIPILKDIKESIDMIIDGSSYLVSFVSDSVIEVINIIIKKIEFIMENLETIAGILDSIDKLRASFLAGGVYVFLIEPEIGGIDHIKSDLQKLTSMIPNSDVAGYSVLIALIAGYPNYGDGNAYVKTLASLIDGNKHPISEAYGLKIFLEPNPTSVYALTDYSDTVSFSVRTLTNYDFSYTYNYHSYPKNSPTEGTYYTSGKKNKNTTLNLKVVPDMIYELEVRGDVTKPTDTPAKNFDITSAKFLILRKIVLSVTIANAFILKEGTTYYYLTPAVVRIYNFKQATSLTYNISTTMTTNITDYKKITGTDDIDYSDVPFEVRYAITYTNERPNAISDTIITTQNKLKETYNISVSSGTLATMIKQYNSTNNIIIDGPTPAPVLPSSPNNLIQNIVVVSPSSFPPDPRTTDSFCMSSLFVKYIDRNKPCEIVAPARSKKTIMFYDCQDSIDSMKFYLTFNAGAYDRDIMDRATSRVPANPNDYFYATATTTTPASFELNNFIVGYYVLRMSIYWKRGSIRYQKVNGVLPQNFDIYLHVVDGQTRCFEIE